MPRNQLFLSSILFSGAQCQAIETSNEMDSSGTAHLEDTAKHG